jgi:hypothetical protein
LASWARLLARRRLDAGTAAQRATLASALSDIVRAALCLEKQLVSVEPSQGAPPPSPSLPHAIFDPQSDNRSGSSSPPVQAFQTVSDVAPILRSVGVLDRLLVEPHTLGSLAVSARVCDHPARVGVAFSATMDNVTTQVVWCAACGAMAHRNDEGDIAWIRASIVSCITRPLLVEFEWVAIGVREIEHAVCLLAEASPPSGDLGPGHSERALEWRRSIDVIVAAVSKLAKHATAQTQRLESAMAVLGDTMPPLTDLW